MIYRPKKAIITGLVGDADDLMQEFNRAVAAANHLDQNNVEDSTVAPSSTVSSSSNRRAPSYLYDVGGANAQVRTQGTPFTTTNDDRIFYNVTNGASDFVMNFTTQTTMDFVVGLSGVYTITAASAYPTIDIRFLLDGQPYGLFTNSTYRAAATRHVWIGFRERILIQAGIHALKVQARDRSDASGTGSISGLNMYAFGYAR